MTWSASCTVYHHHQNTLPCWKEWVCEQGAQQKTRVLQSLAPCCENWEFVCCRELLRKPPWWWSEITVRWSEEDLSKLPTENLTTTIISCLCLWRGMLLEMKNGWINPLKIIHRSCRSCCLNDAFKCHKEPKAKYEPYTCTTVVSNSAAWSMLGQDTQDILHHLLPFFSDFPSQVKIIQRL